MGLERQPAISNLRQTSASWPAHTRPRGELLRALTEGPWALDSCTQPKYSTPRRRALFSRRARTSVSWPGFAPRILNRSPGTEHRRWGSSQAHPRTAPPPRCNTDGDFSASCPTWPRFRESLRRRAFRFRPLQRAVRGQGTGLAGALQGQAPRRPEGIFKVNNGVVRAGLVQAAAPRNFEHPRNGTFANTICCPAARSVPACPCAGLATFPKSHTRLLRAATFPAGPDTSPHSQGRVSRVTCATRFATSARVRAAASSRRRAPRRHPLPASGSFLEIRPAARKNAFGSNDARRRDEFLHHIRARQFVEQVNSEARASKPRSSLAAVGASIASADSSVGTASGAGDSLAAGGGLTVASRIAPTSPLNPRATGSLAASLADTLAGLTKTRDFAARTEFDRRLDPRSPRTVYGVRARASSHSAVDTGSLSRTSGEVGDGLDAIRPTPPEARKVSIVREFFRTNGGH